MYVCVCVRARARARAGRVEGRVGGWHLLKSNKTVKQFQSLSQSFRFTELGSDRSSVACTRSMHSLQNQTHCTPKETAKKLDEGWFAVTPTAQSTDVDCRWDLVDLTPY